MRSCTECGKIQERDETTKTGPTRHPSDGSDGGTQGLGGRSLGAFDGGWAYLEVAHGITNAVGGVVGQAHFDLLCIFGGVERLRTT